MKKVITLFLIVVLAVACFAGCSSKSDQVPSQATLPSTTEEEVVEYDISTELVPDGTMGSSHSIGTSQSMGTSQSFGSAGQHMIVTAKDPNGEVVWTYQTASCAVEEYETVQYLGKNGDVIYINEQERISDERDELFSGYLTALDVKTGAIKWQSVEFTGSGASCVFDDCGNIYLCSQTGPDCAAFNEYGLRMWVIEDVSESSSNAKSIEMVDGELVVSFAVYDDNTSAETHIGLDGTIK